MHDIKENVKLEQLGKLKKSTSSGMHDIGNRK
jgi:hypothetical protein